MLSVSDAWKAGGATLHGGATDPRLKPAAQEFEACLMKELLEPLQKDALSEQDGEGSSAESSGNALMSFGSEALARAIAVRGGFGIAAKIIDHFATPASQAHANAVSEGAGISIKKCSRCHGIGR